MNKVQQEGRAASNPSDTKWSGSSMSCGKLLHQCLLFSSICTLMATLARSQRCTKHHQVFLLENTPASYLFTFELITCWLEEQKIQTEVFHFRFLVNTEGNSGSSRKTTWRGWCLLLLSGENSHFTSNEKFSQTMSRPREWSQSMILINLRSHQTHKWVWHINTSCVLFSVYFTFYIQSVELLCFILSSVSVCQCETQTVSK